MRARTHAMSRVPFPTNLPNLCSYCVPCLCLHMCFTGYPYHTIILDQDNLTLQLILLQFLPCHSFLMHLISLRGSGTNLSLHHIQVVDCNHPFLQMDIRLSTITTQTMYLIMIPFSLCSQKISTSYLYTLSSSPCFLKHNHSFQSTTKLHPK